MAESTRSPTRASFKSTLIPLLAGGGEENSRQVVKECVILVHDASRFAVAERTVWHLNRLYSRPIQLHASNASSTSTTSPLRGATFDIGPDLTVVDLVAAAVDALPPPQQYQQQQSNSGWISWGNRRPHKAQRSMARSPTGGSGGSIGSYPSTPRSSVGGAGKIGSADGYPGTPISARASPAAIGVSDVAGGANNGLGDPNSSTSSGPGGFGRELQVLPASEIWFAHKKYRVVVCLDLSTSVFHQRWGQMPADSFVDAVMMFIEGIVAPAISSKPCGTDSPVCVGEEIYVSVIAYASQLDEVWNLVQGYLLWQGVAADGPELQLLREILKDKMRMAETRLCNKLVPPVSTTASPTSARGGEMPQAENKSSSTNNGGVTRSSSSDTDATTSNSNSNSNNNENNSNSNSNSNDNNNNSSSSSSSDNNNNNNVNNNNDKNRNKKTQLEGMAEAIVLSLKFMPLDAAPIAALVTDGCEGHPTLTLYDGMKMRLCRADVVVSCILIDGSGSSKILSSGARGQKGWRSKRRRAGGKIGGATSINGDTGTGTSGGGASFGPPFSVSPFLNPFEPLDQCLVPSSTSLAHLAAITGGWFYTLESLRAAIEDGRRGRTVETVETRQGTGVGSRTTVSSATSMGVYGGVGEGDGPSVALCQPDRPLNPSLFQRRTLFRGSPLGVHTSRNRLRRHTPDIGTPYPQPFPQPQPQPPPPTPAAAATSGGYGSALASSSSAASGNAAAAAVASEASGIISAGTSPDLMSSEIAAAGISTNAARSQGCIVGENKTATKVVSTPHDIDRSWRIENVSLQNLIEMRCSEGFRAIEMIVKQPQHQHFSGSPSTGGGAGAGAGKAGGTAGWTPDGAAGSAAPGSVGGEGDSMRGRRGSTGGTAGRRSKKSSTSYGGSRGPPSLPVAIGHGSGESPGINYEDISAGTPEGFGVGSPDGESGSFGRGRSGRSTPLSSSAPTGAATGGIGPGGSRRDSNSSCGSGGRSGTGGGGGGGSGRLAGGAVVMARLALAWRKDVRLDYCITFKLQALSGPGHQSLASPGSADVTVEVLSTIPFLLACRNRRAHYERTGADSLIEFIELLQKMDKMLELVWATAPERTDDRELDGKSAYRYLLLGNLSVDVWQRFFSTEYVEVIFRGVLADEKSDEPPLKSPRLTAQSSGLPLTLSPLRRNLLSGLPAPSRPPRPSAVSSVRSPGGQAVGLVSAASGGRGRAGSWGGMAPYSSSPSRGGFEPSPLRLSPAHSTAAAGSGVMTGGIRGGGNGGGVSVRGTRQRGRASSSTGNPIWQAVGSPRLSVVPTAAGTPGRGRRGSPLVGGGDGSDDIGVGGSDSGVGRGGPPAMGVMGVGVGPSDGTIGDGAAATDGARPRGGLGQGAGGGAEMQSKEALLHNVCEKWCTQSWSPGLFLKVLAFDSQSLGQADVHEADRPGSGAAFALLKVVWETPTLAVLHVACFGLNSARRADMMAELRREIWSAGGVVATAHSADTSGAGGSSTSGRTLSAIGRTVSTGALASSGSVGGQVISGEHDHDFMVLDGEAEEDHVENVGTEDLGVPLALKRATSEGAASSASLAAGAPHAAADGAATVSRVVRGSSISSKLTVREGLLHKINTGLSGLETNIAFQLMRSRPLAENTAAATAAAAAAARVRTAGEVATGVRREAAMSGFGPSAVRAAGMPIATQFVAGDGRTGGFGGYPYFPASIGTNQNHSWAIDGAPAMLRGVPPQVQLQQQPPLLPHQQAQNHQIQVQQKVQSLRPGSGGGVRYPVFSGDDHDARPAGLGDRFSDASLVKHVASYLRRRRWLWSFDGGGGDGGGDHSKYNSGTSEGSFNGGSGRYGNRAEVVPSGDGGGDGGGVAPETWNPAVERIVNALARSRRADGFVIVELRKNEALMVKGIRVMIGVIPDDASGQPAAAAEGDGVGRVEGSFVGGRGRPRPRRLLLQYRVFEAAPGKIGTELLMEPQHGHVFCKRESGGEKVGNSSSWMPDKELFRQLIQYLHASDQRVLSAFNSFFSLRDMCRTAVRMSPAERARHNACAIEKSSSARRTGGGSGLISKASRGSPPGMHRRGKAGAGMSGYTRHGGGGSGGFGGSIGVDENEDGKTSRVVVPKNSLVSLLVHADQHRNPLRMIHFAEAIPSPPPPPTPVHYQTPSPIMSRGNNAARRSGGSGSLVRGSSPPPTVRGLSRSKSGIVGIEANVIGGREREGRATKADELSSHGEGAEQAAVASGLSVPSAPANCITCGVSPVVRLGSPREMQAGGKGGGGCDDGDDRGKRVNCGGVGDRRSSGDISRTAIPHQGEKTSATTEEDLKQPNVKLYNILAAELETLNDTCIPWAVSRADFSPTASTRDVIFQSRPSPNRTRPTQNKHTSFSQITPPDAIRTVTPVAALPPLPGASGDLPSELTSSGGRWFARCVGDHALLLTFLPSIDVWRDLAAERLKERKRRAEGGEGAPESGNEVFAADGKMTGAAGAAGVPPDRAAGDGREKGTDEANAANPGVDRGYVRMTGERVPVSEPVERETLAAVAPAAAPRQGTMSDSSGILEGKGSRRVPPPRQKTEADLRNTSESFSRRRATPEEVVAEEHSLGLFMFLVRSGDFGLPIELPNEILRDIRRVLLAHIPRKPLGALSAKPRQRVGWGDDPRGGRVGLEARRYQVAVNLVHRQTMFRLVFIALRNGTALCGDDLSFALSGCGESSRQVDITELRKITLSLDMDANKLPTDDNEKNEELEKAAAACDTEFTRIVSRYLQPLPFSRYYMYWNRDDSTADEDLQEAKTSLTAPIPGRPAAATVADPTGSRTGMNFRAAAPRSGVADSATFPMVSSSGLVADPVHPLEGSEQPPLFVRFECEHFPGQSFSADEDTEVDSAHTVDIFSGMTSSSGGRGADGPVRGGHPHTLNPCPVDSNNKLSSALRRYPAAAPPGFVDAGGGHEVVSGTTVLRVVATTVPTVNFRETEAPDEASSVGQNRARAGTGGAASVDGEGLVSAAHLQLTQSLDEGMRGVYAAEVLRYLMRKTPVTVPDLHRVFTCLKPMLKEEVTRDIIPLDLVLVDNSSSSAWSAVHRAREMLDRELLAGKNPSLRRAVPSERTDEDVEASNAVNKLFFVVEELPQTDQGTPAATAALAGGQGGRKVRKDGASEKYTIPYWAVLRVVEEQPSSLRDDKDQGEQGWLFADNAALHPMSQGVTRRGTASTSARRSTPPPPAPALLSHHVSPVSSQSSLSFGGGRGPTGGVLPSPHGPSEPVADVCPPTVSVNMKICVHHPAGSALASKKEDVVKQLRLGLLERAKRVNRLLLLENLHELKTAYDVLIPPPPPPPPALPPAAVGQRMGPGESPGRGASAFAPVHRRRPSGGSGSVGMAAAATAAAEAVAAEAVAAEAVAAEAHPGRQMLSRSISNPPSIQVMVFGRGGKGGQNRGTGADSQQQQQPPRSPSSSAMASRIARGEAISTALAVGGDGRSTPVAGSETLDPTAGRPTVVAVFGNAGAAGQRPPGVDRSKMNTQGRIMDGRRSSIRSEDIDGGRLSLVRSSSGASTATVTGVDDIHRYAGRQGFREGELQCDCVYRRRFPMNHRLQPLDALKVLRYVNLDQFAVHGRSNTYVYRDNHRHVFYMKLSEASSSGQNVQDASKAIELSVFGVEEVSDEIKVGLSRVIERALAEQACMMLVTRLEKNSKFQVTPADIEFVRTSENEDVTDGRNILEKQAIVTPREDTAEVAVAQPPAKPLPGHGRAWFSIPKQGDGMLDSYLLLGYLRQVLCADGLMHILNCHSTEQQQQSSYCQSSTMPSPPRLGQNRPFPARLRRDRPQQQQQQPPPPPPPSQQPHPRMSLAFAAAQNPPLKVDVSRNFSRQRRRSTGSSPMAHAAQAPGDAGGERCDHSGGSNPTTAGPSRGSGVPAGLSRERHQIRGIFPGAEDVPLGITPPQPPVLSSTWSGGEKEGSMMSAKLCEENSVSRESACSTTAGAAADARSSKRNLRSSPSPSPGPASRRSFGSNFLHVGPAGLAGLDVLVAPEHTPAAERDGTFMRRRRTTPRGWTDRGKNNDGAATRKDDIPQPPPDVEQREIGSSVTTRGDGVPETEDDTEAEAAVAAATLEMSAGPWTLESMSGTVGDATVAEEGDADADRGEGEAGDDEHQDVSGRHRHQEAEDHGQSDDGQNPAVVEVDVDFSELTFYYMARHTGRDIPGSNNGEKRTMYTNEIGKGIAIAKLCPLDCAANDGERSATLRTGFAPPSISTVEAHVSSRATGPDVRLIIGEEKLKECTASKAKAGAADDADKAPAGGETAEVAEAATGEDRMIVLELEIFACGAINVRSLMKIIKRSFEQALTEYMMERVLLRDRAGSTLGFLSSSTTTGSPNETSNFGAVEVARSPQERSTADAAAVAAVAAAVAVAECETGRIGGGTPATGAGSGSGGSGGGVKPTLGGRRETEDGGGDTSHRFAVPADVRKVIMTLKRLSNQAVLGSSPIVQRTAARELVPWWSLLPMGADIAQTICHLHPPFYSSTVAVHLPARKSTMQAAILRELTASSRAIGNATQHGNATEAPGVIVILLGLSMGDAPKTLIKGYFPDEVSTRSGSSSSSGGSGGGTGGAGGAGAAGGSNSSNSDRPRSSFSLSAPQQPDNANRQQPAAAGGGGILSPEDNNNAMFPTASGGSTGKSEDCKQVSPWQQQVRRRGMFCMVTLSAHSQTITTYNCKRSLAHQCREVFARNLTWSRFRRVALDNLLCQERGQFRQAPRTVKPVLLDELEHTPPGMWKRHQAHENARRRTSVTSDGEPPEAPLFLTAKSVSILANHHSRSCISILKSLAFARAATPPLTSNAGGVSAGATSGGAGGGVAAGGDSTPHSYKRPTSPPNAGTARDPIPLAHRRMSPRLGQKLGSSTLQGVGGVDPMAALFAARKRGISRPFAPNPIDVRRPEVGRPLPFRPAPRTPVADPGNVSAAPDMSIQISPATGRWSSSSTPAGPSLEEKAVRLMEEARKFAFRCSRPSQAVFSRYIQDLREGKLSFHEAPRGPTGDRGSRPTTMAAGVGTSLRSTMNSSPGMSPRALGHPVAVESRSYQPADSAIAPTAVAAEFPMDPLQLRALYMETLAARIAEDEAARVALWEAGRKWTFGYELERRWTVTDDVASENDVVDTVPNETDDNRDFVPAMETSQMATATEPVELKRQPFWAKQRTLGVRGGSSSSGVISSSGPGSSGVPRTAQPLGSPSQIIASTALPHVSPRSKATLPLPGTGGVAWGTADGRPAGGSSVTASELTADLRSDGRMSGRTTPHGERRGLGGPGTHLHSAFGTSVASVDPHRVETGGKGTLDSLVPTGDHSNHVGAQCSKVGTATAVAGSKRQDQASLPDAGEDRDDPTTLQALERLPKRVHHTSTYPLIIPVGSPPLKILSARGPRRAQDNGEAVGGEDVSGIAHNSPVESHFSGPWGGTYTEDEGRWGSGRWKTRDRDFTWDALGPLPRRTFGSGGMGSISEVDAVERQRMLTTSSGSSAAVTHFSGGGRSITPDHVVHGAVLGAGWIPRDNRQHTQSSETAEGTERSRSRSAANSRDSIGDSIDDERYQRATSLAVLSYHVERRLRGGGRIEEGSPTIDDGGTDYLQELRDGSSELPRRSRSVSVSGIPEARAEESTGDAVSNTSGLGGLFSTLRRKTSAVDDMENDVAATHGSSSVAQTAAEEQRSRGGLFSSATEVDAVREQQRAHTFAVSFVKTYAAYLVDSLGFRIVEDVEPAVDKSDDSDESKKDGTQPAGNTGGDPRSSVENGNDPGGVDGRQPAGRHNSGRGRGNSTSSHDSGCGGPILARALLRLALPWTSSIAMVEFSVRGDWDRSGARAAAIARTNPKVVNTARGTSESLSVAAESGDGGAFLHRSHQPCLTDILTASIRMWTVDVVPPTDVFGYRVDNPSLTGDGGDQSKGEEGSRGGLWPIVARLPTLRNFRSTRSVGHEDGGNELPHELSKVLRCLRFREAVNDYIVGQVEAALSFAVDDNDHFDSDLGMLFSQNAYGVLWQMAEASAAPTTRCWRSGGAAAPVVRREFISMGFAEIGAGGDRLFTTTPAPRRSRTVKEADQSAVVPRNNFPRQSLQAPIPRRAPDAGLLPPLHRPASRSPAPPSAAATPVGWVCGTPFQPPTPGTRDELKEAATKSRLMWYVWEHADIYGLKARPPSTDRKPMVYGTVFASPRAQAEQHAEGEVHEGSGVGGSCRGSGVIDTAASTEGEGPAGKKDGDLPVCTFVLTTPDDEHRPGPPLGDSGTSAGGTGVSSRGGVLEDPGSDAHLDVVVFIIPPGQPIFRLGWPQEGVGVGASSQDSEAERHQRRSSFRRGSAYDMAAVHSRYSPPLEDVAKQARHLVERLLRMAMAHMRRDAAWRQLNKADWGSIQGSEEPRRRMFEPPHVGISSPASCGDGTGGGDRRFKGAYGIDATTLRHLLNLSGVARLQDVDPRLSHILAPDHDMDWAEWCQQMMDSPQFFTLLFEDGDAVLRDCDEAQGDFSTAATRAAFMPSGASAAGPEHNDESGDSRYRMLLVRPNLVLPVEREVEDDGHGNGGRETRESGRSAAYVNNGEGPWVGRAGITNIRDLTSHFLHVALDKDTNTVTVSIVRRLPSPRLSAEEQASISAVVNDIYRFCAEQLMRMNLQAEE